MLSVCFVLSFSFRNFANFINNFELNLMKILVIGSGGREHALVSALGKTGNNIIYATPGNPGIFELATEANINSAHFDEVASFCKTYGVDMVVVGPEQPLADGISDYLQKQGIAVFGPSEMAARLESSKAFAKAFMVRHGIPTAKYKEFYKSNVDEADRFIDALPTPIVLKADGLAAGKGVIIAETHTEAHNSLHEMFNGQFSTAGDTIVIEEFLEGEEASVFAVCDGMDFVVLPAAQDHKRIFDGDKGPNTGGMGAYSPAPIVSPSVRDKIVNKIIRPTLKGMKDENMPFVGCLFVGLMIKDGEPKVIEFNVRFGDPETEAVLTLLNGDFSRLLYSAAKGKIDKSAVSVIRDTYACCVILASNGYPGAYNKGYEISGIGEAYAHGGEIFQAGTKFFNGTIVTSGGRVMGVTGQGKTLQSAIDKAYECANLIKFEGKYNRTDIGKKGLKLNETEKK